VSLCKSKKRAPRIDKAEIDLLRTGSKPTRSKVEKPKEKVRSVAAIQREADRLAAAFCKSVGRCEAMGWVAPDGSANACSERYEWAHVKSRGQLFLRHNPRNSFSLCNVCHRRFTEHPDHWYRFVEDTRPGTWDYLNAQIKERRDCKVKMPLREVYADWIGFYKGSAK
jgi:hypothetical protein